MEELGMGGKEWNALNINSVDVKTSERKVAEMTGDGRSSEGLENLLLDNTYCLLRSSKE